MNVAIPMTILGINVNLLLYKRNNKNYVNYSWSGVNAAPISSLHHARGRGHWAGHRIVTRPVNHLTGGSMSYRNIAGSTRR